VLPYQAVFLDRDGVINQESDDYIKSPSEWHPIPSSLAAMGELTRANIPIIVITNQSGIGRGLYDEAILVAIHEKMRIELEAYGAVVSRIYYCPHTPDDACDCRKPKPGLIQQALDDCGLNPNEVIFIGDSLRDLVAGQSCGCDVALVLTGYGKMTQASMELPWVPVYTNLSAWVKEFLNGH
jgi:D-glycero-D-manno-heptose 1,7-bisphosphate phosphatase